MSADVPRTLRSAERCAADPGPHRGRSRLCGAAQRAPHRVRDTVTYTSATPHHSAMNSAVALVDFRSDSSSTYSLKPCIAAPGRTEAEARDVVVQAVEPRIRQRGEGAVRHRAAIDGAKRFCKCGFRLG